jgi:hypothetical protein
MFVKLDTKAAYYGGGTLLVVYVLTQINVNMNLDTFHESTHESDECRLCNKSFGM